MNHTRRLWVIAVLILLSAGYAVLVKKAPDTAHHVAVGYVACLVTILVLLQVWKHNHDHRT
jgi:hypothetical protein